MTAPAVRKKRKRWLGRSSLIMIMALFVGSAVLRLTDGAGLAFARASSAAQEPQGNECTTDAGVMALLDEVQRREQRVIEREGLMTDRTQALQLAEKRMEERLAALRAAEDELAKTVSIAEKAADEDVARLVTLYENMKPKDAARLFEEMAPEFAAGFMARMRPDAAAAIMAGVDPKVAYTISVLMAGRNANAPKN
ncbi:hypothetical protein [Paenirhodobacter sp. CAU 1674]|uniref:MotE family protein n=1 Tax=Paenirhodobacter sp. CAU 1674 TaxID=3032596 RepID=UPI0023D990ED|nr:hypothetical protein [Paenirhodobacter sp. CAU 1674]MDF2142003.1 hypothetical protein [Paenirhodobacter sp. CAU 1674]